jgi:CheY-like chemotaxis protein
MAFYDETTARFITVDGRSPRVALVGGTPAGAMVAAVLLEQFGCLPVSTPTGESILAMLRSDATVDLVVVDLSVPDMDGIVAVQLIRAMGARGEVPVIALTGDRAAISRPRARAAGFAGILVKPYSPRELYAVLHSAFGRVSPAPAAGAQPAS